MTLAEFGSWGLKEVSVANPEPNNKYKGQCVSLIQQYLYKVFNKPFKAYGNAKDWEYNYPKDYFTKLDKNTKLQPRRCISIWVKLWWWIWTYSINRCKWKML